MWPAIQGPEDYNCNLLTCLFWQINVRIGLFLKHSRLSKALAPLWKENKCSPWSCVQFSLTHCEILQVPTLNIWLELQKKKKKGHCCWCWWNLFTSSTRAALLLNLPQAVSSSLGSMTCNGPLSSPLHRSLISLSHTSQPSDSTNNSRRTYKIYEAA